MGWIQIVGFIILGLASAIQADLAGLKFYLYTKSNKVLPVEIKASDNNTFNSPFVAGQPVKFLCHGYTSVYTAAFPRDMKNAYLQLAGTSYNIIAVDWDALSRPPYDTAANNTRAVGREIANLMKALISAQKSQLKDFHFLGHSLGGQVGAFISNNLDAGEKIPRVTGLDPARPGFNSSTTPPSERLDPSDADFVDIIRTSPGVDSKSTVPDPPIGKVDWYPNGGVRQPGCLLDILNLCSHSRAYEYYTESLTNPTGFKSYQCSSYQNYKGNCSKTSPAFMGESVSHSISGTYYLDTKAFSPYAEG